MIFPRAHHYTCCSCFSPDRWLRPWKMILIGKNEKWWTKSNQTLKRRSQKVRIGKPAEQSHLVTQLRPPVFTLDHCFDLCNSSIKTNGSILIWLTLEWISSAPSSSQLFLNQYHQLHLHLSNSWIKTDGFILISDITSFELTTTPCCSRIFSKALLMSSSYTSEQCENFATGVKSLVENLDAATSILHQDGSETLLEPVERCRCWPERGTRSKARQALAILTNTNVSGNPADVDVSHVLLLDDVLQAGLRELLVVKERRVGVDIGVGSLIIIFGDQTCLWLRGNAWGPCGQVVHDVIGHESETAGSSRYLRTAKF